MQEIKLTVKKRDITGRKVKNIRKQNIVPANIYGKKVKSQAVSLALDDFEKVFSQAGETGVIKVTIEGEKEERPILIQNVQFHPVTEKPLHVDFRQIILTEKVTAKIPVELEGEAPAVAQRLGILIQTLSEIEVEALPMDLLEKISVDVSKLVNIGDEIKVKDLAIDKKITLKVEEDLVVAKIESLAAEEVVPTPTETVAEGEGAPVEESGQPGEGKKTPESTKEEKQE